jgi:hypothetical protein
MSELLKAAYESAVALFISTVEYGLVPDFVLRQGIRYLLSIRAKAAVRIVSILPSMPALMPNHVLDQRSKQL